MAIGEAGHGDPALKCSVVCSGSSAGVAAQGMGPDVRVGGGSRGGIVSIAEAGSPGRARTRRPLRSRADGVAQATKVDRLCCRKTLLLFFKSSQHFGPVHYIPPGPHVLGT